VKGWSEVVNWTGTPLRHSAPPQAPEHISLTTPDDSYFAGLDRESALHPQTLLAWEMNGQPLTSKHGAPLLIVISAHDKIRAGSGSSWPAFVVLIFAKSWHLASAPSAEIFKL